MTKIAINGFGRIGRHTLKVILDKFPKLQITAINDLTDSAVLAHLLKYDSSYGIYNRPVKAGKGYLMIGNRKIEVFSEKDPQKLNWKNIDIVLECTGVFRDLAGAQKHLKSGAKRVIISAPSKSDKIPCFILGVNENDYDARKHKIMDMGSCTTNCLAPVAKVLNDEFKIVQGFMSTIHSYTNDQKILDLPHQDLRRARSAGQNIIPTTTGAALSIGKVLPELKGKLDGSALRVPVPVVSIIELVCQVEKKTNIKEVNSVFNKASKKLKGILMVEDNPLVSSDYKGNAYSAVIDSSLTRANGNLVKVSAWYDNEWAYSCRLAEFANFISF